MTRSMLVAAFAAGMIAAVPAIAQQRQTPNSTRQETGPTRAKDDQVANLQQKLNDQGFNAGQVDGFWGPNTSAALKRYQARNGLQQTGQLDQRTTAALPAGTAAPVMPVTQAQATTAVVQPPSVTNAAPSTVEPATLGATSAAAANNNQAVATTAVNAPQPAIGANSFTAAEARGRIERSGYTEVADLKKDGKGVWRGHGVKGSTNVSVWLDYKGNVGQQ